MILRASLRFQTAINKAFKASDVCKRDLMDHSAAFNPSLNLSHGR